MIQIALVEDSCRSKARFFEGCNLPTFYMEDFTILGFPVTGVEVVKELLNDAGYTLFSKNGGYQIALENRQQVAQLYRFFQMNKIDTSLTDIADTFYQA